MAPGHARVDLRADLHLRDVQRLHTGARCFATGHHQLAHAPLTSPRAMAASVRSTIAPASLHAQLALDGLDGAAVGGGIHQHRAALPAAARPRPGPRRPHPRPPQCAAGQWPAPAAPANEGRHLPVGGQRAAARHHGLQPARWRQGTGGGRRRARPQFCGRPMATPEPAVTSGMPFQGRPQAQQVVVGHRVHHGQAHAVGAQRGDARAHGVRALRHHLVVDQPHLAAALRLQHAHQVGVGHGGERVVLHAAFVQQHVAHEQVALEHRAAVVGEGGRGDGEVCAQRVHQRLGTGPILPWAVLSKVEQYLK
jgi:hypothetical protein